MKRMTRENQVKTYVSDRELEVIERLREAMEYQTGARVSVSEFVRRALLSVISVPSVESGLN